MGVLVGLKFGETVELADWVDVKVIVLETVIVELGVAVTTGLAVRVGEVVLVGDRVGDWLGDHVSVGVGTPQLQPIMSR